MKLLQGCRRCKPVDKSVEFVNNRMHITEKLPKITKNTKVINRNLHFCNVLSSGVLVYDGCAIDKRETYFIITV